MKIAGVKELKWVIMTIWNRLVLVIRTEKTVPWMIIAYMIYQLITKKN